MPSGWNLAPPPVPPWPPASCCPEAEMVRVRLAAVTRVGNEAAAALASVRALVEVQANDETLWFVTRDAEVAYLQQALRALIAAVEGTDA